MPNITISLDEHLLKAGRQYAKTHNTSLNALIRRILEQTVTSQSEEWLNECLKLMDQAKANSHGKKWMREDLYEV